MRSASNTFLVDTNILVYAFDAADREKRTTAIEVLRQIEVAQNGVLSIQVLGEFYSAMTRKRRLAMPTEEAAAAVANLARALPVLEISLEMVHEAVRCAGAYRLSYWDSLIWATAKFNDIQDILSEDRQHGQVIEGIRNINPFAADFDLSVLR
jgi:predicted nucleic acid-binding protein